MLGVIHMLTKSPFFSSLEWCIYHCNLFKSFSKFLGKMSFWGSPRHKYIPETLTFISICFGLIYFLDCCLENHVENFKVLSVSK